MAQDHASTGTAAANLSPLDGRYRSKIQELAAIGSEAGLIERRLLVELKWLLHLATVPQIAADMGWNDDVERTVKSQLENVSSEAAARVKDIELTTNHDVKAVEYYLREQLQKSGIDGPVLSFIHFGCTSEDINNTAYALIQTDVRDRVLLPIMSKLQTDLRSLATAQSETAMLSRTHGQSASPSTVGKEIAVFAHRLAKVQHQLAGLPVEAKWNGAVGNYNAHYFCYPDLDWEKVTSDFLSKLGLRQNPLTTQIENHDSIVAFLDCLKAYNQIAIGLCRDMWSYISLGYFRQKVIEGEVGSSTMPHKVNPIDFENAEGNFGLSSALCEHLSAKLPISRWQRDLSDSTALRSFGSACGYSNLAMISLAKGLAKVEVEPGRIAQDLTNAWEVLAEPLQMLMRRRGVSDAYERLKKASRGAVVSKESLHAVADSCEELTAEDKIRFKQLTPERYTGKAAELVKRHLRD